MTNLRFTVLLVAGLAALAAVLFVSGAAMWIAQHVVEVAH